MANEKPDTPSSAYTAMMPYWEKIDAILGGADAMRAAGKKYLPQFAMESDDDYKRRCGNAKFTNIVGDIVEALAAKPFTEEVKLQDGASEPIKVFAEDVDGKGNHLNVFAQSVFFGGIAQAITWILIDYTKGVPPQATIAQEKALGARPWWVSIPPTRLFAVYSDIVAGVEIITHARILEPSIERDGYDEKTVKRVRIFNREAVVNDRGEVSGYSPATWTLLEERKSEKDGVTWIEIGSGPVTIGIIPLVPFTTGRRLGSAWQLIPSMRDAVDLQITLYQQESGLEYIKECAAFPMLAGNGVPIPTDATGNAKPIPIGPKAVLYAPPSVDGNSHGEWTFIEPDATSMKFLSDDIEKTKQDLRELGRQPLTAQTGNLTVVTTAFAAQKGNSAIQAWAFNLKDALERALQITCLWLKDTTEPEVQVDTDFDIGLNDDKDRDTLVSMRGAGDLSQRTLWREMQRRSVLSPEFDPEKEEEALLTEVPGDEPNDADMNPRLPAA